MKVFMQLDGAPGDLGAGLDQLSSSGATGAFTFEGQHDVFVPLAAAAGRGADLELMTNVAIAIPRSPLHLAHAAWDLHLLSSGRFRLGLGSQIRPHIERRYGSVWSRPVARMRESVVAVKEILDAWQQERTPDHRGEFFTHTLTGPNFTPGPHPYGVPPVLLGALGPRMTRTAGEVADGLLVMPFNSRQHLVERTFPALEEGFTAVGRTSQGFEVIPQVVVAMGSTPARLEEARAGAARLLAFYASTPAYTPVLEIEGWADFHEPARQMVRSGRFADALAAVPADMLTKIAVSGDPAAAAAAVADRFGDFADTVCCYFPGYEPSADELREFVATLRAEHG